MREALLLDLGAIIFELHRQRRREPELLKAKAVELTAVDDELRELSEALEEGHGLPEIRARGLVATCQACAGIMGVRDRHCPSCGAAAGAVASLNGGDPDGETVDVPMLEVEPEGDAPEGDAPGGEAGGRREAPGEERVAASGAAGKGAPAGGAAGDGSPGNGSPRTVTRSVAGGVPAAVGAAAPWQQDAPVPRAQRTLRAGRERARAWLAERRSERP